LWPHRFGTAGFFAARLTKLDETQDESQAAPGRPLGQAGWFPLTRKEAAGVSGFYQETYGVDLNALLERHALVLWRRGSSVYVFPEAFFERFSELPVQGLGLLMGEDGPDGLMLAHEWVARFGEVFQRGRCQLTAEQTPAWLRGEDVPGLADQGLPQGSVLAVFDEENRLLGRGKLQTDRLKNLLPRRLF
jgi:16S rRNA (cytosine1407-C5)-methyltransferase